MMVERRRWLDVLSYVVVIIGIAVVAFPVYLALVASTQTAEAVEAAPMSLVPGDMLIENYRKVLFVGGDVGSRAPVGRMMLVSLTMAVGIAVGKIIISLLSAFAIVYFRFPLRYFFFWMIFVTLMLPVEVRITPDVRGDVRPRAAQHVSGIDHAADRLGHRHLPVPPVLHDRA